MCIRVCEAQPVRLNGRNLRNVTLREVLSGIDYMEVNRDGVTRKLPSEPYKTIDFGKSVRKLAFLRIYLFRGELITALTAAAFGSTGNRNRSEGEESGYGDGEVKNHAR